MQGGSNGMEKFIEIPCIVLVDELIINLDVILDKENNYPGLKEYKVISGHTCHSPKYRKIVFMLPH